MRRLVVTFGLLAVLLAACGGSSSESGEKKQFISKGDAFCTSAKTAMASAGSATDTATLDKVHDAWAQLYDQLKGLPVPQQGFETANNFVAEVHNAALTADGAAQASKVDNNQAKVTKYLSDLDAQKSRTAKTAGDYGFKTCNQL